MNNSKDENKHNIQRKPEKNMTGKNELKKTT